MVFSTGRVRLCVGSVRLIDGRDGTVETCAGGNVSGLPSFLSAYQFKKGRGLCRAQPSNEKLWRRFDFPGSVRPTGSVARSLGR